ncbi:TIGR00180 family glycosyltransferase [Pseudodesulfovibrio sediminis]|uniref:Glycosyl transferase family 2 n=1 Tax=Pseudodesulfovibrio sediminis TaxID=2810563 RepID=A0ABN6EPZ2_9BACT|nr:TIGR00180 family glycosyltransferase [Pseudodesulfovibrio sediminis]BCS87502.1 hypothetical protein PSDVSF_07440 [Pseudodesulfovibrio sediminis]
MYEDKVTIYVPTFNRHAFLKRVLDYYADSGFQVLVTDDSEEPFPEIEAYPNLVYCQTGLPFAQSMVEPGVTHLKTPYMVMCADDTLIPVAAIKESVAFLEENPEYCVVQGYQSSMYYSGDSYYFKIESSTAPDYGSQSPSNRLLKFFSSQHRLYWGVWRTDAWKEVYTSIPLEILNEPRTLNLESMIYFMTPMVGKLKRLPIFFALHEDVPSVAVARKRRRKDGFTHWDFATKEMYRETFELFVKQAAKLLLKYEALSVEEAETYARMAFMINGLHYRQQKGRKTLVYRVKRELRSLWNKTLGRRAVMEKKQQQREARESLNKQRLEAMRPQCRAEMEKAAEFLFKYPRCKANDE